VAGQKDRPVMLDSASDDLTQRMERLPPGHPSSPYDEDGTRKPPVPRTTVRELPLPDEIDGDAGPDESAEPAVPDSPPEGDTDQGSLDTHDLTDKKQASFEAAGQDAAGREAGQDAAGQDAGREAAGREAGQDAGKGKTGADKASESDAQDGEASVTGPPTPETSPPDSRSWWQALPHLKEQWEHHKERWPQEQHQPADRSNDEPNSWRGDSDQYLNTEENLVARHAIERIRPVEEKVTATLQEIKTQVPDCNLAGLEFRLKGEERFKEKISDELRAKPDRPIAEITERMPDAIRYTFQLDADRYVAAYWNLRQHLELDGSELLMSRNSWNSPDYKGVNTRWLSPEGQVFEVQFHTAESYQAKHLTHGAYERLRTGTASGAERPELESFQQDISARLPVPVGAMEIPDYRNKGY
jgi:hypothetical protein